MVYFLEVGPFLTAVAMLTGCDDPCHQSPSREMAEFMALSTALESYKVDHGTYPSDPQTTERLRTNTVYDPVYYVPSSEVLYRALSGNFDGDPATTSTLDGKRYYAFTPQMLRITPTGHTYVIDPWGNSYGYSTFGAVHPGDPAANNPTFDLWSTRAGRHLKDKSNWVKNW